MKSKKWTTCEHGPLVNMHFLSTDWAAQRWWRILLWAADPRTLRRRRWEPKYAWSTVQQPRQRNQTWRDSYVEKRMSAFKKKRYVLNTFTDDTGVTLTDVYHIYFISPRTFWNILTDGILYLLTRTLTYFFNFYTGFWLRWHIVVT